MTVTTVDDRPGEIKNMTQAEQDVLPEGKSCLYALDHTGDSRFMWSKDNPDEVEAAKKTFKRLLDKGYDAFKVRADGSKGEKISSFDPDAEKIIMSPRLVGG